MIKQWTRSNGSSSVFYTMLFLAAAITLLTLITACGGGGGSGGSGGGQDAVVSTIAGVPGVAGSEDATGFAAQFNLPDGITSDGSSLYVVDTLNYTIRSITPASGTLADMTSAKAMITTLAGTAGISDHTDGSGTTARFWSPVGITTDGINLYISDGVFVRKLVLATGNVSTLAGTFDKWATSSKDGTGTSAHFYSLSGITTDGSSLYVIDGCKIRRITPASGSLADMTSTKAVVTTLAGDALSCGYADGSGTTARFSGSHITTDGINLYVADYGNQAIRRITPASGTLADMTKANALVTTLAGSALSSGNADGSGADARFAGPTGITTDGSSLYVADSGNLLIRRITPASGTLADMTSANAVVTTLAGAAGTSGHADGIGAGARFYETRGIFTDGSSLYVSDSTVRTNRYTDGGLYEAVIGNQLIRRITPASGTLADMTSANAVVTTLAGVARIEGSRDGIGKPPRFNHPDGISTDGQNVYVADAGNATIRQIELLTGAVITLAGSPGITGTDDGIGSAARFDSPSGLTNDGSYLYCTDSRVHTVRRIDIATGEVTTIGGQANTPGSADGPMAGALFNLPSGITTDGINLYISDGGHTLRKLVLATGEVSTLAGTVDTPGSADGIGTTASFRDPGKLTTDGTALYLADTGNHAIRKIAPASGTLSDMTSADAMVTTLAGTLGTPGSADGTGTTASFTNPVSVTSDGSSLYVTEWNHTVRMITPVSGSLSGMTSANAVVTTLAGQAGQTGYLDSHGIYARFDAPADITTDGQYLYVTDYNSHTVRRIE